MAAANSLKLAELDETLAIRAAYHAAWLIYENGSEGLADEIPAEAAPPNADASKQLETIIELVSQGNPPTAIAESNSYAASGHDGIEFLRRLFLAIGHDFTYAGQRCMTEAWYAGESHPERNRILAATVGAEAHYRMREDC